MDSVLATRRRQSQSGLRDVRHKLKPALQQFYDERVTLYVTGSFGRLEARYDRTEPKKGSDLDVFFMYMPEDRTNKPLLRLAWFKLIAAVIDAADALEFKPFSRDGEFLKAHNVFHVGSELGSRHEDADNGFTARLLLLLEGRPLANDELFENVLLETVRFYFRDYAENRETFRPDALINDILRYWRTLCLNYEHQREDRREKHKRALADIESDDRDAKQARSEKADVDFRAESTLANLKLRYSRLALCFSMISVLASEPEGIMPERVVQLCRTIPSERWELAARRDRSGEAAQLVPEILAAYETFLELVADQDHAVQRLRDPRERGERREQAQAFGDLVYRLIGHVTSDSQFRRLLV